MAKTNKTTMGKTTMGKTATGEAATNGTSDRLPNSTKKEKSQPDFAGWAQTILHPTQDAGPSKPTSLPSGLYIVATPIGNLGDITLRALWALREADLVFCEDTRVTGKLLHAFGLSKPMMTCHDHNEEARLNEALAKLALGQRLVLVSDAGTPLISDPGYRLVRACRKAGYPVYPLPGASALLASLAAAGLPSDRFTFIGFLPSKPTARRKAIEALPQGTGTLIFYESPQRIATTLTALSEGLGPACEAVTARELTKLHEEFQGGTLEDLAAHYAEIDPPKGEMVLLVAARPDQAVPLAQPDLEARLRQALETLSLRDAVDLVAKETGLKRKEVYQKALTITDSV